ncbi:hypothetical protein MMC28_007738 [Mycoblastus sanguinarius]|nr:hypothetical protein [Mycoblastus sanguinarius]
MHVVTSCFLVLIQYTIIILAAPATAPVHSSLTSVSSTIDNVSLSRMNTSPRFLSFPSLALTPVNSSLSTTNAIVYPVRHTTTILSIRPVPGEQIDPYALNQTLLIALRFLDLHLLEYGDSWLLPDDDPYESHISPDINCRVFVATSPATRYHMTYGIAVDVLSGLYDYMYVAERYESLFFSVRSGTLGTIGTGMISRVRA